ncbi:MAG: DNRLRE domain-containing protein [Nibricoccus sp.]
MKNSCRSFSTPVQFGLRILFRSLLLATVLVTIAPSAQALAGFPTFNYLKLVEPSNPVYDPSGEFIFPCVIKASDHVTNPKGTYYLFYAPHNNPGGICVAYSNNIEGPYSEFSGNPVISNTQFTQYTANHISSPFVMWMPEYNQYYLYYHGPNDVTRWAYSTDLLNWTYGGVCATAADMNHDTLTYKQLSYAKVYRYTIPGKTNKYIMLAYVHPYADATGGGGRIGLLTSNDGRTFTRYDAELIMPGGDGVLNLCGPVFYPYSGKYYIVYHTDGDLYITEVGGAFTLENHLGVFHKAMSTAPDKNRVASPFFMTVDNINYMFYEAGDRLSAQIALAKEAPSETTATFNSIAGEDGWVLESAETSSVGGSANSAGKLIVGDDPNNKQYRAIVSFDTSSLPDSATIISAKLTLKRDTVTGTNPFTTHGACVVSVVKGAFSDSTALSSDDFQAAATANNVATMPNAAANGDISIGTLNSAGLAAINKTGRTQFRIAFTLDDNDDSSADTVNWFGGDDGTISKRPILEVTYR